MIEPREEMVDGEQKYTYDLEEQVPTQGVEELFWDDPPWVWHDSTLPDDPLMVDIGIAICIAICAYLVMYMIVLPVVS